jgi:2-methylcitrate dehydratase PrpD
MKRSVQWRAVRKGQFAVVDVASSRSLQPASMATARSDGLQHYRQVHVTPEGHSSILALLIAADGFVSEQNGFTPGSKFFTPNKTRITQ